MILFCTKRLRDFFFSAKRLLDFLCAERLHVFFSPRAYVIFFVQRGCKILLGQEVARYFL